MEHFVLFILSQVVTVDNSPAWKDLALAAITALQAVTVYVFKDFKQEIKERLTRLEDIFIEKGKE